MHIEKSSCQVWCNTCKLRPHFYLKLFERSTFSSTLNSKLSGNYLNRNESCRFCISCANFMWKNHLMPNIFIAPFAWNFVFLHWDLKDEAGIYYWCISWKDQNQQSILQTSRPHIAYSLTCSKSIEITKMSHRYSE